MATRNRNEPPGWIHLALADGPFERLAGHWHFRALGPEGSAVEFQLEYAFANRALDKVLGFALRESLLPLDRCVLMVSGRVSFEIMQKALAGGIPLLAAVSAPSSLAVQFAEQSGQTLVGFLRGDRMNVYAHGERLTHAAVDASGAP